MKNRKEALESGCLEAGHVDGWSQIRTSYYNELLENNRQLREALHNLYAQAAPFNHNGDAIWEAVKLQVKEALGTVEGEKP